MVLHADSEDSDQTGQMLSAQVILLVLSSGASNGTIVTARRPS